MLLLLIDSHMGVIKKIISTGTWILFTILFVFSILAGVAQSSNPGDRTYGFKLQFEKGLLVLSSVFDNTANLQIDFTKNRVKEVQHVFASNQATVGITNLNTQIEATRKTIQEMKDPVKKTNTTEKYITLLNEVSTQLSADKQILQSSSPIIPNPTSTLAPIIPTKSVAAYIIIPTAAPTHVISSLTTQPALSSPAVASVTNAIDQTQEKIQQTIEELRKSKDESGEDNKDNNMNDKERKDRKNKDNKNPQKGD